MNLKKKWNKYFVKIPDPAGMRVSVKILQGAECNVDILAADSVEHLKQLVQVPLITDCAQ